MPHSRQGLEALRKQILQHVSTPEEAPCFLETSQGLLVQFLLESGFPVYPPQPQVVDYRRKPWRAKSDAIDARLLADIGRSNFRQLRRLNPDSEHIQELKTLCRDQDALLKEASRLASQLIACLKEYYPRLWSCSRAPLCRWRWPSLGPIPRWKRPAKPRSLSLWPS